MKNIILKLNELPYITGGIYTSPRTFPFIILPPGINTKEQNTEEANSNWTASQDKNNLNDFWYNFMVFILGVKKILEMY